MAKYFAQISASVALVYVDKVCWQLDKDHDEPQICRAPQMHNIHRNFLFEEIEVDEEYPFPQVRDILQKKQFQQWTFFLTLRCLDSIMSQQERKEFANKLSELTSGEHFITTFKWLSELLLNTELSPEANVNQEILDCMPKEFQDLIRQVFKKTPQY